MTAPPHPRPWRHRGSDERDDHYLGLAGAQVVATEALLALRDNLADVVQLADLGDCLQGMSLL